MCCCAPSKSASPGPRRCITMSEIGNLIAELLAVLFGMAAIVNLAAPAFVLRIYRRWAFARGFYYVVGAAQGLTALFLAVPQTRIWGGILGAMILFVIVRSEEHTSELQS